MDGLPAQTRTGDALHKSKPADLSRRVTDPVAAMYRIFVSMYFVTSCKVGLLHRARIAKHGLYPLADAAMLRRYCCRKHTGRALLHPLYALRRCPFPVPIKGSIAGLQIKCDDRVWWGPSVTGQDGMLIAAR